MIIILISEKYKINLTLTNIYSGIITPLGEGKKNSLKTWWNTFLIGILYIQISKLRDSDCNFLAKRNLENLHKIRKGINEN